MPLFDNAPTRRGRVVEMPQAVIDPLKQQVDAIEQAKPDLRIRYASLQARAKELATIQDQQGLTDAENLAKETATLKNEIAGLWEPVTQHWHRKHDEACEGRGSMLKPVVALYTGIKNAMKAYLNAVEAARMRQEAIDRAAALRAQQELAKAAALQQQQQPAGAAFVPPPPPVFTPPPVRESTASLGSSALRKPYRWKIENKMDLIRAIASGRVPIEVFAVDEKFMDDQVSKYRGSLRYPGVLVYPDIDITIR